VSNRLFPALIGLAIAQKHAPTFRTRATSSVSFTEARIGYAAYPIWRLELAYEFLRSAAAYNELDKIRAFFTACGGARDSFLYTNPDDNQVTDHQFGIGDGTTTQFQLLRTLTDGGTNTFSEPVQNVNALTNIKDNGVTKASPADYSVSATGLVTFTSAPAAAHPLTWSGTYYWRVRFEEDALEFEKFMYQLYSLGKVALRGSVMNKILP
jgi:uncharacterized protein (TIGR02217 family)